MTLEANLLEVNIYMYGVWLCIYINMYVYIYIHINLARNVAHASF